MRSYAAQEIIALPKLSTAAAVALGQGLLTAAKAQTALPALITTRLRALEVVHEQLRQALIQKPQLQPNPKRAREADLAEDQAWSAFHDWLVGWSKVPRPEADSARTMYALLFATRLKATRLPLKVEWAEADARLSRITSEGLEKAIDALGGRLILTHLREMHRIYGEALGITAEVRDASATSLRVPLDAFTSSLRGYVVAVAAHADPADAASLALADALLSPLQSWAKHLAESAVPEASGPASNGTTEPRSPAAESRIHTR